MKYKIGDNVLIKAKIESIEITKDGIVYNVLSYKKHGRFLEEYLAPDHQQEQTQEPTGG